MRTFGELPRLPEANAELLVIAREAIDGFDASIVANDEEAAKVDYTRYWAAVSKLNGGSEFGCLDDSNPNAGGIVARDYCMAPPGMTPKWGQQGEFVIEVDGIRAVVECGDGYSPFSAHFQYYVLDVDRTFVSESGYRSCFEKVRMGMTVSDVAEGVFASLLIKERRSVKKDYRERVIDRLERWPWLVGAQFHRSMMAMVEGPQLGFGF